MTTLTIGAFPGRVRLPLAVSRLLACVVVAAASTFLSEHYGAPVMQDLAELAMTSVFPGSVAMASTDAKADYVGNPLRDHVVSTASDRA
ncbi:hypothetical protein AB4Z46_23300 [Variovorax sp. M-6]|uniref:hypothetical protein n=1 Tax=Variovorax sp. M-6 TaxID=3233041 RepID=UPI003F9731E3